MSTTSTGLNLNDQPPDPDPGDSAESSPAGDGGNLARSRTEQPYAVGYGRPPEHTRFKAGKSGNPKGRPKRVHSLEERQTNVLLETVVVVDGNRRRRVPAIIGILLKLRERALKGDSSAARAMLRIGKDFGLIHHPKPGSRDLRDGPLIQLFDFDEDDLSVA